MLLGVDGPTIIDLPQPIDAAANQNARRILIRDVDNLTAFLSRWVPDLRNRPYGQELWDLYERAELTPDTRLTGRVRRSRRKANVDAVVDEIAAAIKEESRRRAALGLPPVRGRATGSPRRATAERGEAPERSRRRRGSAARKGRTSEPTPPEPPADDPFSDLDALLIAED